MRTPKSITTNTTNNTLPPGASTLERTPDGGNDETDATGTTAMSEEAPAVEEKGESGRTHRDMQAVTDHYDERPIIDIRKIEKAIDKLVQIREADLRTIEKPFTPKVSLKNDTVRRFMDKTSESRLVAEKYLDAAEGDLKVALLRWIETPFGVHFPDLYSKPGPLADPSRKQR